MRYLTHLPRTLTQTLSWNAMILNPVLLSLITNKFYRPKLRGILWRYSSIGDLVLLVNPYLMLSGSQDSQHISKGWSTYVSITFGFGWIQI